MGPKAKAALVAFGAGALLGLFLAQYTMGRYRRDLFSPRPLRRLSALGYLSGHPSVGAVRLLRDYLAWERHPMLRRRAEAIVRRMETRLA
jgi:membrane-associated PAP2 superfamily phosphatase